MLDYKLLQALATVVESDGFERAGEMLGISQSAISQRIKTLEIRLGHPVLIRHPHLAPTPAGQKLLTHYQQVVLLERDLRESLPTLDEPATRLRIAINADSLATWWADTVASWCQEEGVLLDMVVEDQDVGLKRMRDGDVAACLCATPQPIAGARCEPLGEMCYYYPLATPTYRERYFAPGVTDAVLAQAPAIVYGPHDQLQHRFLAQCGYHGRFPYHLCPSSEGFVQLALAGVGYGMIPRMQVEASLENGQLVCVADAALHVPLYWHTWRHSGGLLQRLTTRLRTVVLV
ncbi:ArgP/LysG family DNA-binding transcriptional regulator [Vreelandella salicampi]|uniref:LysR family transcriptional regulator ArgP n=1 Tax=Vreelandella salicampi TaxID=1449798 RepID=A0A7Z0LPC5_9GAMM|nr:LysR family transcriptional regulator ArgP [Halomonas salicampi]